jgi:hypothetical protein
MSSADDTTWYDANQAHLSAALAEVREELERKCSQKCSQNGSSLSHAEDTAPRSRPESSAWAFAEPPALESLCSLFALSSFERKVLLMCAGAEMDARFPALFGAVQKDSHRTQPTFSLALSVFSDGHWSALTPARPLRSWRLLAVCGGETLATSPLRIEERVLHHLAGVYCIDERLQTLMRPVAGSHSLVPSHQAVARQMAAAWSKANHESGLPVVQLCGNAAPSKKAIAAAASAMAGMQLHAVPAWGLPESAAEMEALLRLWERDAVLNSNALLLESDDEHPDAGPAAAISWLVETIRTPLIVTARSALMAHRPTILFEVENPTRGEQAQLWQESLQASVPNLDGRLSAVVSQFNLGPAAILSAAWQACIDLPQGPVAEAQESKAEAFVDHLWDACRIQARPRVEELAQRIEPAATWEDLVLPDSQKQVLGQIAVHVRQRAKVYQTWGFANKGSRGLGISALFAGASGTGKTMAAEVLAKELRLDLYRIDLSQVVSKYIGETEKNLRRVFDAADEGAAVLLFDEADALFGKRSEVKDSHDRYANIEVSYLLQRMEAYRGLAVLTTNRKNALDQAFLRRIRFVVEFPFPEAAQRAEIWRRVFPTATPTDGLKIERLSRLHATGGHIRNIAMRAAFLAADAGEPVRMSHLLHSARSEFAKMEKPLPDTEVAGWV